MPTIKLKVLCAVAVLLSIGAADRIGHAATLEVGQMIVDSETNHTFIPVRLTPGMDESVCAIQFDIVFDESVMQISKEPGIMVGDAAKAANKQVNSASLQSGTYRIIVAGFNQEIIPAGELIRLGVVFSEDEAPSADTLMLERIKMSDPGGLKIPSSASHKQQGQAGISQEAPDKEVFSTGTSAGAVLLFVTAAAAIWAIRRKTGTAN